MIKKLAERILYTAYTAKEGHIPSALSILNIIWVLYDKILSPQDKFILSKGHGCLALYVVLAEKGIIPKESLDTFGRFDSILGGHPDMNKITGVEASTGSLGHGLPIAVGLALGKKLTSEKGKIFCLIGDGELNEGSIWESMLIASHHELGNLVCIVDSNRSTDRALDLGHIVNKFRSFGWLVRTCNGHDNFSLSLNLGELNEEDLSMPMVLIADTFKGHGVFKMEQNPEVWHHKAPNEEQLGQMIRSL